jgi:hypothetical protein
MTERAVSSGNASDMCSGGVRFESSSSSAAAEVAKEPFLSHNLPQKILRDFIRSSLRFFGFRNNVFSYTARSLALRPNPNLEDQVSVFMSPSDRVAQLYPKARGSPFVAFYDSEGHGGDILTLLHTGSDSNLGWETTVPTNAPRGFSQHPQETTLVP